MPTWFMISSIAITIFLYGIFILWADWKAKCRKTIKENYLTLHIPGYVIMGDDSDLPNLHLLSGLLGINTELLVFVHRFQDESMTIEMKIADIKTIEIVPYQEESYYKLIAEYCGVYGEANRYYILNMAGLSTDKKIPKLVQARSLCKIRHANSDGCIGGKTLFCFKETAENLAVIEEIKRKIGL